MNRSQDGFVETLRTPGNPLNEGDQERMREALTELRRSFPEAAMFDLAWFGLARCLGSTHTIPDKENTDG